MSLDGGQILIAQFKSLYMGKFFYNTLHYAVDGAATPLDIDEYMPQFVGIATNEYADCLVETATVIEMKTWLRGDPNPFETRIDTFSAPGTIVGEGLPPFVSATLKIQPLNSTKWPAGAQDFKYGRVALGGVPESASNGGVLQATYRAALQALCDVLYTVPSSTGFGPVLKLYLDRTQPVVTSTGLARVFAQSISPWRVGSQNTRKT